MGTGIHRRTDAAHRDDVGGGDDPARGLVADLRKAALDDLCSVENPALQERIARKIEERFPLDVDLEKALAWFNLAASSGDTEALKNQAIAEKRVGRDGALAAQQRSKIIFAEIEAIKKSRP